MLPLGAMRLRGTLYWLAQFSGWDHERYVVVEVKAKRPSRRWSTPGEDRVETRSQDARTCDGLIALLRRSAGRSDSRLRAGTVMWETGTFSILGFDPATGEVGGAVQSRVFSVGNGVLWADANVGVAATQAIVDVGYGPKALALLRTGLAPAAIVKQIWEQDPDPLPDDVEQAGTPVRGDEPEG